MQFSIVTILALATVAIASPTGMFPSSQFGEFPEYISKSSINKLTSI
jgi:hypothetical protein